MSLPLRRIDEQAAKLGLAAMPSDGYDAYTDDDDGPGRPDYPYRERLDTLIGEIDEGCRDFSLYCDGNASAAKVGEQERQFLDKLFGGQLEGKDVADFENFLTVVQLALYGREAKAANINAGPL